MKIKLAGILLGAFLASSAFAAGMSCGAGKCGASMNQNNDMKPVKQEMQQEMNSNMKGSCGAGKCGGEMKKEMEMKKSSSCGTGKCGASMNSNNDMKPAKKEVKGSCGTGKCGSN